MEKIINIYKQDINYSPMGFIQSLLWIFYFLLPAGLANMAPVLFKKVNFLNTPIDFNIKFGNKELFGSHKTYRGFFFGIIVAIVIVLLQKLVYNSFPFGLVNYNEINIFLLGFLLGFGALFGDLVESFFKRRIGIKSGKVWFPFDQIDWVIGAFAFVAFYLTFQASYFWMGLGLFLILHLLVNYLGYLLKIKDTRF